MDTQEEPYGRVGTKSDTAACYERVVVTAPTTPRMKVLLEEKIVVNSWKVRI